MELPIIKLLEPPDDAHFNPPADRHLRPRHPKIGLLLPKKDVEITVPVTVLPGHLPPTRSVAPNRPSLPRRRHATATAVIRLIEAVPNRQHPGLDPTAAEFEGHCQFGSAALRRGGECG